MNFLKIKKKNSFFILNLILYHFIVFLSFISQVYNTKRNLSDEITPQTVIQNCYEEKEETAHSKEVEVNEKQFFELPLLEGNIFRGINTITNYGILAKKVIQLRQRINLSRWEVYSYGKPESGY